MGLNYFILFAFGSALGSFLNVVARRYEPENRLLDLRTIGGRSHCPKCGRILRWYELIPIVSFVLQLGRCRGCGKLISLEYPFVEILAGLFFVFIPQTVRAAYQADFFRVGGALPVWFYALSGIFILAALTLLVISLVDLRFKIIPDQSNVLIAFLGLGAAFVNHTYGLFNGSHGSFLGHFALLFGFDNNIWINRAAASAGAVIFFALIVIFSRGRGMGLGDLKLAGALGLLLGWPDIGVALLLAFIIGAFWSIILMVQGKESLKSAIPFGPFIALGSVLTIFFGKAIMAGYFDIFG